MPALLLYDPVLNDTGYITGAGADTRVLLGAFLELLLIVANIATAIVLYPILKRQSESIARGYVTADDVKSVAYHVLRHRLILTYEAEAENMTTDNVIKEILSHIEVP